MGEGSEPPVDSREGPGPGGPGRPAPSTGWSAGRSASGGAGGTALARVEQVVGRWRWFLGHVQPEPRGVCSQAAHRSHTAGTQPAPEAGEARSLGDGNTRRAHSQGSGFVGRLDSALWALTDPEETHRTLRHSGQLPAGVNFLRCPLLNVGKAHPLLFHALPNPQNSLKSRGYPKHRRGGLDI